MMNELTNSDGNTYTQHQWFRYKNVRSSAPLSKFKVKVDNAVVDSSNYTLTEGSTIVTFRSLSSITISR